MNPVGSHSCPVYTTGRPSTTPQRNMSAGYDPYQENAPQREWADVAAASSYETAPSAVDAHLISPTSTLYSPQTPLGYYNALDPCTSTTVAESKGGPEAAWVEVEAPQQRRRGLLRSWWQEITSAVFSMACIVAIVVILDKIDGTPLSSWGVVVSPNAVISVLIVAAKAAMIQPVAEGLSQLKWLHLHRDKSEYVHDSAPRNILPLTMDRVVGSNSKCSTVPAEDQPAPSNLCCGQGTPLLLHTSDASLFWRPWPLSPSRNRYSIIDPSALPYHTKTPRSATR